jgi:hypothetical protein
VFTARYGLNVKIFAVEVLIDSECFIYVIDFEIYVSLLSSRFHACINSLGGLV